MAEDGPSEKDCELQKSGAGGKGAHELDRCCWMGKLRCRGCKGGDG